MESDRSNHVSPFEKFSNVYKHKIIWHLIVDLPSPDFDSDSQVSWREQIVNCGSKKKTQEILTQDA